MITLSPTANTLMIIVTDDEAVVLLRDMADNTPNHLHTDLMAFCAQYKKIQDSIDQRNLWKAYNNLPPENRPPL